MTPPTLRIDLNADLGEGAGDDEALLALVSSANIACGGHAGDAATMRAAVRWALARGVAIGAHPGFPDRAHFGRRDLHLSREALIATLLEQMAALDAIVRDEGGRLAHVKAHGQLYNQAAQSPPVAEAICEAVRQFDPALRLVGLAGSALIDAARAAGLVPVQEVFADRGYQPDGRLVPRSQPGALIEDEAQALAQTLMMVREQRVRAIDGSLVPVAAQTVCLHGDGPHALAFARRIRARLAAEGIVVAAVDAAAA